MASAAASSTSALPLSIDSRFSSSRCWASLYAAASENTGLSAVSAPVVYLSTAILEIVDLQLVELGLLGVDLGLLVGDLDCRAGPDAVLRGVVLVVEPVDLVLDRVELVGDLLDLLLLVADPVGVGGAGDDAAEEQRECEDGAEAVPPGVPWWRRIRCRHDGPQTLQGYESCCEVQPADVTPAHSHSMVPGGFDVMS